MYVYIHTYIYIYIYIYIYNYVCIYTYILKFLSFYNSFLGVEQQGFFSGSNFLLPLEIRSTEGSGNIIPKDTGNVISDGSKEHWPSPGEASKSVAPLVPGTHLPIYKTAVKLMMLSKDAAKLEIPETAVKVSAPAKQQKRRKEDRHKRSAFKAYIGNEYECPRGHRYYFCFYQYSIF